MPLQVQDSIWEDVSIDFFVGLPKTKWGIDSIMVVEDNFLKMTHFVPCKEAFNVDKLAYLFFQEIVWLHVLSQSITSYRDAKFVSNF